MQKYFGMSIENPIASNRFSFRPIMGKTHKYLDKVMGQKASCFRHKKPLVAGLEGEIGYCLLRLLF